MNILNYLDNQIEIFYQKNNNYPNKIIMSKETKDKIFDELNVNTTIDNCWIDRKDNYRGIKIKIKENTFIELG